MIVAVLESSLSYMIAISHITKVENTLNYGASNSLLPVVVDGLFLAQPFGAVDGPPVTVHSIPHT